MFLGKLGMKTDRMISEFVKSKVTGDVGSFSNDKRRKAALTIKLDKDIIWEHIMSDHPQVSQYKLQNAPNKRYLERHLTITAMWEDYN